LTCGIEKQRQFTTLVSSGKDCSIVDESVFFFLSHARAKRHPFKSNFAFSNFWETGNRLKPITFYRGNEKKAFDFTIPDLNTNDKLLFGKSQ
jgi:hypothetical protein